VRWILTFLAWLLSAAFFAPACFFAVVGLAGPHGGVLPSPLQPLVLVLAWTIVLIAPVLIARSVWRRVGSPDSSNPSNASRSAAPRDEPPQSTG